MRRSWRVMSASALVLAAASILFSAYLFTRIQAERERNIRTNCVAQNERHDDAIAALDEVIATAPLSRRARARQGRQSTVFLLEAIVPRRDCDVLVHRQVNPRP